MNFIKRLQKYPVELQADLQLVIRCKNCKYFLPLNAENRDTAFDGLYKDYPWQMCEEIGADGLCINTDKWQETNGFCSDARPKSNLK